MRGQQGWKSIKMRRWWRVWNAGCYLSLGLWYALRHRREGERRVIKRRVISFPRSLGMSVQSHRAGLDPFTTQSEGQGLENFLFLHPPHSHSLHPSFFHLLPMHKHVSTNTCTYDALTYTLHHSCVCTHTKSLKSRFLKCFFSSVLHLFLHCKRSYKIKREGGWMGGFIKVKTRMSLSC